MASTRQLRYHEPPVAGPANGFATCSNSDFNGATPNLARAREIAAVVGTRHGLDHRAAQDSPSVSKRATSS